MTLRALRFESVTKRKRGLRCLIGGYLASALFSPHLPLSGLNQDTIISLRLGDVERWNALYSAPFRGPGEENLQRPTRSAPTLAV